MLFSCTSAKVQKTLYIIGFCTTCFAPLKNEVCTTNLNILIMTKTTIENQVIFLNTFKEQQFNNRPMRLSGSRMNLQHPAKWIDGLLMHHYIHSFIYLDEIGGMFEIECDYENKFIMLNKC